MSAKPKNVPGAGNDERQEDWSIWSITEDVAFDGTCSKRKRAFLKQELPRFLESLEMEPEYAQPNPAPWHIPMGFMDKDELVERMEECGWAGYWFTYACKAADKLQIPCPDERYSTLGVDEPWTIWALHISSELKHFIDRVDEFGDPVVYHSWLEGGHYLGNRRPRKGNNLLASSVPLSEEELHVEAVAEMKSRLLWGTKEERLRLLQSELSE